MLALTWLHRLVDGKRIYCWKQMVTGTKTSGAPMGRFKGTSKSAGVHRDHRLNMIMEIA